MKMMELFMLGTGGTYPLVTRALASSFIRVEGIGILIDCGEATQIEMQKYNIGFSSIDYILITHMHADHISGLLGMLLAIKSAQRTKPVTIIGPKNIKKYIESMFLVTSRFPFPLNIKELEPRFSGSFTKDNLIFRITYANHNIPCFSYSVELKRKNRFNIEKVVEDGVPKYNLLEYFKHGHSFTFNGIFYDANVIPYEKREELANGRLVKKRYGEYVDYTGETIFRSDVDADTWNKLKSNYFIDYNGVRIYRSTLNVTPIKELTMGKSVELNGKVYNGLDYIEGPRRGLKISYVTDTRPLKSLREFVKDSDIAVIEGMYRGDEDSDRLEDKYHMTWDEAVSLVKDNNVREMILTHYSPSLQIQPTDKELLKSKYNRGTLGRDGLYRDLKFIEEPVQSSINQSQKEEETHMQKNVKKDDNGSDERKKILLKYFDIGGYTPAIMSIDKITSFKYKVVLAPDIEYVCYVYKNKESMKVPYMSMMVVDNYYVYLSKN